MSDNTYTGILVYEGLKGLRHERSMYLGSYGVLQEGHAPRALNQTIQEVVSNSIDEHLIGAGDEIIITIHKDNSVSIQDFGRGMPKGPDDEFTDVINSLTKPHASGKFEGNGYAATGTAGMHGIGLKATNATSKFMTLHAINHQISVDKSGQKFDTGGFEEYEITLNMENVVDKKIINKWPANKVELLTKNSFKVVDTGEVITTGTRITYLPDDGPVSESDSQPVFESINWVNSDLYPRFESSAFLNEGLKIQFIDERVETDDHYLVKNWYFKNGLEEYVSNVAENQTLLSKMKKPITFKEEMIYQDLVYNLQASLIITDDTDTNIRSFANSVPTKDGGPHVDGFNQAITNAINNYAKDNGLNKIKSKGKQLKSIGLFSQKDVLEGITGVFEIKLPAQLAEFEGQTKEKLATVQAKYVVNELVYKHITNWLYDNKSAAEQIITKIIESKMASDAAIKARQEAKKARVNKSMSNLKMSGKFKPASSRNPKEKELFITEGDSASNISVDRKTQAIMPIRGKIRNVHDLQLSDALTNDEISTITNILGTGIGPAFDITDLQFWKVIFACFTGETKVKAIDGKSYSFKELVDNNIESLWVYALDKDGNVVPAKAKNIRKTGQTNKLIKLTLDNGKTIKATPDHMFMTINGNYVRADNLKPGTSLMPLHTKINKNGYEEYFDKNTGKFIKTYRRVAEFLLEDDYKLALDRLSKEVIKKHQNSVQVHHANENKLDNRPENLKWLTAKEHFSKQINSSKYKKDKLKNLHMDGIYKHTYFGNNGWNGSTEHINRVKLAHKKGNYEHTYFGNNGWNGSQKQRNLTKQINKSTKHIKSVAESSILSTIKFLQVNGFPFNEYYYDYYRNIAACRYNKILNIFDSYEDAFNKAKNVEYKQFTHAYDYLYEYNNNKKQKTQIAKVIKKLMDHNLKFNEENYNRYKGKRTVSYKKILNWFDTLDDASNYAKNLNHKVIKVEELIVNNEDVYCLTVPEYHNFLLDSGVFVKNCDAGATRS